MCGGDQIGVTDASVTVGHDETIRIDTSGQVDFARLVGRVSAS